MNESKLLHKVNIFFAKELLHNVKDVVIFQNENDSYEFFNKYLVIKENNSYKTSSKYESDSHNFVSLKVAMAWCIFKNQNKYESSRSLENLNQLLSGYEASILIHKHLIRKTKNLENKLLYIAKLTEEKAKRTKTLQEIQYYLEESKLLQSRKFAGK